MSRELKACRALDLTDSKGLLCGAILAQMGVDVIKIEAPGGDAARRIGPFLDDLPHPDRSLTWIAFNVNKRSVTLSLESETGKSLFRQLVSTADFVVESFAPGYLESLGLGYETLKKINPGVILTSITPFGRTGPYADYRADDLTVLSMGGFVYSTGDPDRPPVRISADQAYLHAAAYAATATMMAYRLRKLHGYGQHVDVSAQEAIAIILGGVLPVWWIQHADFPRMGKYFPGPIPRLSVYTCKDGYVSFNIQGEHVRWGGIADWMESEEETRVAGADLRRRMEKLDFSKMSRQDVMDLEDVFARFFAMKTRAEIWEQARKRHFLAYPVNSVSDNLNDEHLKEREYFVPLACAGADRELVYPRYLWASTGPGPGLPRPAPTPGEHNQEIYATEMGLTPAELARLASAGII